MASDTDPPQRYETVARASEVDPNAVEHPEINFVFTDKDGKATDLQHAVVDTRVPSEGKLVIWLMAYNQELFDRLASYGYHAIQPHYANQWFGSLDTEIRDSGVDLGTYSGECICNPTPSTYVPMFWGPFDDMFLPRSR